MPTYLPWCVQLYYIIMYGVFHLYPISLPLMVSLYICGFMLNPTHDGLAKWEEREQQVEAKEFTVNNSFTCILLNNEDKG